MRWPAFQGGEGAGKKAQGRVGTGADKPGHGGGSLIETVTPTLSANTRRPPAEPWRIDDELDVRFYFSGAASGLGLRSNLGAQLEALAAGTGRRGAVQPAVSDDEMVERLDDALRAARVGRLLMAVGPVHAEVLAGAYHADEVPPAELRQRWGELAGVVAVLGGPADSARERAELALGEAQGAYARARAATRRRGAGGA